MQPTWNDQIRQWPPPPGSAPIDIPSKTQPMAPMMSTEHPVEYYQQTYVPSMPAPAALPPGYAVLRPNFPPANPTSTNPPVRPRVPLPHQTSTHPRDKGVACALFRERGGQCPVINCPYAHIMDGTTMVIPGAACAFYQKARCLRESCSFFHGPQAVLEQLRRTGHRTYHPLDYMPVRNPLEPLSVEDVMTRAADVAPGRGHANVGPPVPPYTYVPAPQPPATVPQQQQHHQPMMSYMPMQQSAMAAPQQPGPPPHSAAYGPALHHHGPRPPVPVGQPTAVYAMPPPVGQETNTAPAYMIQLPTGYTLAPSGAAQPPQAIHPQPQPQYRTFTYVEGDPSQRHVFNQPPPGWQGH
jgi:hypothetical protein